MVEGAGIAVVLVVVVVMLGVVDSEDLQDLTAQVRKLTARSFMGERGGKRKGKKKGKERKERNG